VDGTDPLGPSLILGHTPEVGLQHYNRANALEASRRHDARISEAENAAARLLGRPRGGRGEDEPVPSLRGLLLCAGRPDRNASMVLAGATVRTRMSRSNPQPSRACR
jgi:hypothetical protein